MRLNRRPLRLIWRPVRLSRRLFNLGRIQSGGDVSPWFFSCRIIVVHALCALEATSP